MFNAIEDALVVFNGDSELKFINYYAKQLIGLNEEPMDKPFLFLFSDSDGDDLRRTIVEEGRMLSVSDILKIDKIVLPHCIFTTSEDLAQCKQMDQVQRIIKDGNVES